MSGNITVKTAAKQLGVAPELLVGLIDGKQVVGERATGTSGRTVWLISRDEIARLRVMMAGQQ